MTSHELARKLLSMPDLLVARSDSKFDVQVTEVRAETMYRGSDGELWDFRDRDSQDLPVPVVLIS
jgi:hypothetical protein